MVKLTAALCIHNEEKRLAACLEKLDFVDEIVVVLDRCTDDSRAVAQKFGAVIIEGRYELEGDRRNTAIAKAKGDWVLEVDADEHIPAALGQEIRQAISTKDSVDYYLIRVDNYIGQRLVRYGWGGSFGTSMVARLFRKGHKHWGPQRVHPKVTFQGKRGRALDTPFAHYVDDTVTDMIDRLNRYTTAKANDLLSTPGLMGSKKENYRKNILRIFSRFYKCYIRRKGYKEGAMGFLIAVLAGLYPILSYIKAETQRASFTK